MFVPPWLAAAGAREYDDEMDDAALLSLTLDLAARAGDVILAVRARGFSTSHKEDRSIVTEADHAAEQVIVAALRAATPGIAVVAEEEIAGGHDPGTPEVFWLVDPLDGTRDFARNGDDFAVCIGLVRHGAPALGAVAVPATGEVFGGIVGGGACKRTAAGTVPIHVRRAPPEGATMLVSRTTGTDPRMDSFLAGRRVAATVKMSSAIKFCRVAEGVADLYPRFGRTMEWDTAAPQAILEAAGGAVRAVDTGAALRYGKPGWENPSFYCVGLD
jgi:3'(2'), 5'-bisphosphate nucleotidase